VCTSTRVCAILYNYYFVPDAERGIGKRIITGA
jgi:hypothetical protein